MEQKPFFKLKGIFLEKSAFEKYSIPEVVEKPILAEPQISVQKLEENQVKVSLHINIFVQQARLSSTMIAVCEFLAENMDEKNTQEFFEFTQISIPAIIFGFMREHITSTFQKAGLPLFIHQPLNFVELAEQKKKNLNSEKP